jgi:hypothetical protein
MAIDRQAIIDQVMNGRPACIRSRPSVLEYYSRSLGEVGEGRVSL